MAERGIDVSKHLAKTLGEIGRIQFDYVITVCGHADDGHTRVGYFGFDAPPKLTRHLPDGEEKLGVYRSARDEIRQFVQGLPGSLKKKRT